MFCQIPRDLSLKRRTRVSLDLRISPPCNILPVEDFILIARTLGVAFFELAHCCINEAECDPGSDETEHRNFFASRVSLSFSKKRYSKDALLVNCNNSWFTMCQLFGIHTILTKHVQQTFLHLYRGLQSQRRQQSIFYDCKDVVLQRKKWL